MRKLSEPHYANNEIIFTSLIHGTSEAYILLESRYKEVITHFLDKKETIRLIDEFTPQRINRMINQIEPRIKKEGKVFITFNN